MITTIIRIVVTLTWLELNLLIFLGIRQGVKVLKEIRDTKIGSAQAIIEIRDEARVARGEAKQAVEKAEVAADKAADVEGQNLALLKARKSDWRHSEEEVETLRHEKITEERRNGGRQV